MNKDLLEPLSNQDSIKNTRGSVRLTDDNTKQINAVLLKSAAEASKAKTTGEPTPHDSNRQPVAVPDMKNPTSLIEVEENYPDPDKELKEAYEARRKLMIEEQKEKDK